MEDGGQGAWRRPHERARGADGLYCIRAYQDDGVSAVDGQEEEQWLAPTTTTG